MIRRLLATAASLALAIAPSHAQMQSGLPPMVPGTPAIQLGSGVSSALGNAANSSGGVVTSPVGNANLASGAAAANLGFTPLNPANNLSDLSSPSTARTSLGLGALATTTPGTGVSSALGNATNSSGGVVTSPVGNANLASGAAAANLGFTPLNPANNLSDLSSPSTARTSLGLGALATTTPGTGVSSALGNAANSSGGVVTSPVGNANLASGAAAANLGFTPLDSANNLSDLSSPSTARTSLGLGALATTTPGSGVSSALGNAANSSGGVVTSPVGGSLVTLTPAGTLRQGLSNSPQSAYLQGVNAASYGARGSVASTVSGTISAGSPLLTLSSISDFLLGDDVRALKAGANYTAGSPSSLSATPCGAPYVLSGCSTSGSTSCTYYASIDDGSGGLSVSASVAVSNNQSTTTTVNETFVKLTPPKNQLPAVVWRNCGASDTYIGDAEPTWVPAITAGSGYTDGGYAFTATGGGCAQEPQGWVKVSGGAIVSVRVDPSALGSGCTSAPTITVSGLGAGGGSGGAVTLNFYDEMDDAGYVPTAPYYVPASHLASAQPDWLIAGIGAVSGNVVTLCPSGQIVPCSTVNATNAITSQNVRHSWTAALNSAVAGADVAAGGNGVDFVRLACGTYDLEAGAITVSNGYTRLHADDRCVTFRFAGVGPGLSFSAGGPGSSATQVAYAGVDGVILDGSAMTAGYCVYANDVYWFWETNLYFNNCPGASQVLGFNNAQLEHVTGHGGEGWGLNDYDFESTVWTGSNVLKLVDAYLNDHGAANVGDLSRAGWEINDVVTINMTDQVAISNAFGNGWRFDDTTGNGYSASTGQGSHIVSFIHGQFDAEFSNSDEVRVNACAGTCENQGFANGSRYGYELYVAKGAQWKWIGGKLASGYLSGAYLDGTDNEITHTAVYANSKQSTGTLPGVVVGPDATGVRIEENQIGLPANYTYQAAPVQIVSAFAGTAVVEGNTFANVANRVVSDVTNPNDSTSTIKLYSAQPSSSVIIRCNASDPTYGGSINDCTDVIATDSVAMVLPPGNGSTSTIGSNGALTIGTALQKAYPCAYIRLPANAITGSNAAGWYYVAMATTSTGTVYNNTYSSGVPQCLSSPTSFSGTTGQAFTTTTGSNVAAFNVSIPGYTFGQNDGAQVRLQETHPNNTNNKAISASIGSFSFYSQTNTTTTNWSGVPGFQAQGATNVQAAIGKTTTTWGSTATAETWGAVDLSQAQTLTVYMNLTTNTDYMVLELARIERVRGS